MTAWQTPSVGRVVHYKARGSADGVFPPVCRAASISEVDSEDPTRIGIVVLNPEGMFFHSLRSGGVWHDEDDKAGGTWHWPERV